MLYIDKLLEDGETFGIDSLDFDMVLPVMEYLEAKGVTWHSGHKLTELYHERDNAGYTRDYVVINYDEWRNDTFCGTTSNRNSRYITKWVTPHELLPSLSPEVRIKRGSL